MGESLTDRMNRSARDWIETNYYKVYGQRRHLYPVLPSLHSTFIATALLGGVVVSAFTKKKTYFLPVSIFTYLFLEAGTTYGTIPILAQQDKKYRLEKWEIVGKDKKTGAINMIPKPKSWKSMKDAGDVGWAAMYLGNDGENNAMIGWNPDYLRRQRETRDIRIKKSDWTPNWSIPEVTQHEVVHHKQLHTAFNPYKLWNFKAYQPYIEFEAKIIGMEKFPDWMKKKWQEFFNLELNWDASNLTKPQLRILFDRFYGKSKLYNMDMSKRDKVVDWFHNKYYGKGSSKVQPQDDSALWRLYP